MEGEDASPTGKKVHCVGVFTWGKGHRISTGGGEAASLAHNERPKTAFTSGQMELRS